MPAEKPRRLGRGLEALLAARPTAGEPRKSRDEAPRSALRSVPIAQIQPNPSQPRKEFDASDLRDLEASIRANGLLQPITVRAHTNGRDFFLIAGERRFRAVQRLGWTEVPGDRARRSRSRRQSDAHARARRKPAAFRSQSDRRGRGVSAAHLAVLTLAAGGRRRRRQRSVDRCEHAAPARAAVAGAADGARRRADHRARARAAFARRRSSHHRTRKSDCRRRTQCPRSRTSCTRGRHASERARAQRCRAPR